MPINRAAPVRFALAFPNEYRVAMASLGYQIVYRMLNSLPNTSCERVFLPDHSDLDEHLRTKTELFTLESLSPLSEFDAVAFSISFELDYLNILRLLKLANIPIRRSDRDDFDPIIIAGGPCATFNPEPLSDFIDAFVIGDAEGVLPSLANALESTQRASRQDSLQAMAEIPGIYVPAIHNLEDGCKIVRQVTSDLDAYPASSLIQTDEAEFGNIRLVEIARGCGRKCRFCVAGHITRPPRIRDIINECDAPRVGMVGAAVFDHPDAPEICRLITDRGGQFSTSSVRLETVSSNLTALMAEAGQRTLTIAPEAGSDRLRRVINKNASETDIFGAVSAACASGINRIKLYFMIGLPTEIDTDISAIIDLVKRLSSEFSTTNFQVSASSFVPKPSTPFQWHTMERENILKKRYAALRSGISSIKGASFSGESPRLATIQSYLARGDRRMGEILCLALENGGDYSSAVRESGIDPAQYLYRTRERDEVLPWDHIDNHLTKEYLWNEYQKALKEEITTPCNVGACKACGACE
ncbi:MAG: radical SAM protein [Armatimonadota bacterium]|nr:radical SAM protein [bacterium]